MIMRMSSQQVSRCAHSITVIVPSLLYNSDATDSLRVS